MKKRWVIQRVRLVPEDGKDWLGNKVEKTEEWTFLCKDGYTEAGRNALFDPIETKKEWTAEPGEVRHFRTEEHAEKVAFMLVVMNAGLYVGHVSVVRVPGRKDLVKVRRRSPEKVNVGRWPHSSGRRKS